MLTTTRWTRTFAGSTWSPRSLPRLTRTSGRRNRAAHVHGHGQVARRTVAVLRQSRYHGVIWQFRVGAPSMTVMAQYSVNDVMSLSVPAWTSYVSNQPGYNAFSEFRCPPGKNDSGVMYCEDCPKAIFNVDYSATQCSKCPMGEGVVITGTSNPLAAENACPFFKIQLGFPDRLPEPPLHLASKSRSPLL